MSKMSRCYIGHLPYRAGERDLEHFFKGYGRITEVILKNGYGFVEFSDNRDADDACHDLDGRELMGQRVTVEMARGIPRGRDSNNWAPQGSTRNYDRGGGGGGGYDRGYGGGGGGRGGYRGGGGGRTFSNRSRGGDYRITVENLSSRVSWQDLKDLFRTVGEVTYADAHSKNKNEGVVEFASRSDMKLALEKLDGKEVNGRKIKLSPEKGGRSSRSKSRSRSRSRHRSASGSRSRSRSRSRSKGKDDKRSRSPEQNGHSPSPKRDEREGAGADKDGDD